MTPEMLAVRRRLFEDFEYYASHALKIRAKDGGIVNFTLNAAQRRLLETVEEQMRTTGKVRVVILKARQLGLSTFVGAFLYWYVSQRKGHKALVVAHKGDATTSLFDMSRRFHENCPEILKPQTRYSSRKELNFSALQSGYMVATAGGDGIVRGETIQCVHLSEVAFYPKSSAAENVAGLMQAVPNTKGSVVFLESTANGCSGIFWDIWQGAVRGENEFTPVFIPWFVEPGYREPVSDKFERSPAEKELAEEYGLDNEQLMFRRRKIAANGPDGWTQEYPSNAEEAFLTSGRPVFHPDRVAEMARNVQEPFARLALEGSEWVKHPRGELLCYREHDPIETYFIGADIGMGVQRDWSVAQVFDSKRRQCAVFRAQADPDYFATVLFHLGHFYNTALICPENNSHGILTCYRLYKDMSYPLVWTDVVVDKISDTETVKIGFTTNMKTKPLVVDKLRARVREREIEIVDRVTIDEMRTFIVTETGSTEAEKGAHDDTVMALALCDYVNSGSFEPIQNKEEWYSVIE